MMKLKTHDRYDYSPLRGRPDYSWPGGKRLAVYFALNLEHFSYGEGLGAELSPGGPQPDILNYAWRDYGNRVGAWYMLDAFDARLGFIAARGLDVSKVVFSASFGRNLDYYTGFVFEAHDPKGAERPVIGGGRYDSLLRRLGAAQDIPAVGAAIWCDRLFHGGEKA